MTCLGRYYVLLLSIQIICIINLIRQINNSGAYLQLFQLILRFSLYKLKIWIQQPRERKREVEEERFILDPLRLIAKTFNIRENEIQNIIGVFYSIFYYYRGQKDQTQRLACFFFYYISTQLHRFSLMSNHPTKK